MKFYKLKFGVDGYDSLKTTEKLSFDFIQSFDGRSHLDSWTPLKITRMHPELGIPLSDAPYFTFPVFNQKALDCLLPIINDDVEVLNLDFDEGDSFYGVNVLTVLNAVDYKKSEYVKFKNSDKILAFRKYCFLFEIIREKNIFKISDEPLRCAFVSDKFKRIVDQNSLTGFIFEPVFEF